ncbi:MAG: DUF6597 domain-containing transcriptional factor [Cyclobacteriaceae bacterium]
MYKQFLPQSQLADHIAFFYIMEKEVPDLEAQQAELLMPSGTPVVGFHYTGRWNVEASFFNGPLPKYYIVGQQTLRYSLTVMQQKTGILGAALKPTTLWHWFKKPLDTFTNNPISTEKIFGERFLENMAEFEKLQTTDERMTLIEKFFLNFVKNKPVFPTLVDEAIQLIFNRKGCISTAEICQNIHIGERYLQQLFKTQVGLSPSKYARITRINNILAEISQNGGNNDLQFLTSFYNYYDAQHFNKDFKSYCGQAPSTFLIEKFQLLKELVENEPYLIQVQKK